MGRFGPDAVTSVARMQQGSDVAGLFLTRPAVCDRVSNKSVGCLGGDNVDILAEVLKHIFMGKAIVSMPVHTGTFLGCLSSSFQMLVET
jgi:hypothetical protein